MVKDMLRSTVNTIIAQIISLLFVFFCVSFLSDFLFKIIIALCALFILVGLNINCAFSVAGRDIKKEKSNKKNKIKMKGLFLGFASSLPPLIMWVILLLSNLQIIGNVLPVYKLTNEYFLIITGFMCDVPSASQIVPSVMTILFFASLIPLLTFCVSYYIVHNKSYADYAFIRK